MQSVHWENVIYILYFLSGFSFQGASKIHDEDDSCGFDGGTKFGPFVARKGPRKLCYLGFGAGELILWDTSVTRVNGRFASDQPCYSSIYHLQLCLSSLIRSNDDLSYPSKIFSFVLKVRVLRKVRYWQELNYVYNCQNILVHP